MSETGQRGHGEHLHSNTQTHTHTHARTRARAPANRHSTTLPVAQLAEAVPIPGSGVTLPLDLHSIAARCTNAYYAPRRFAAVQLAFSNPRCRVLIFRKP